MDKPKLERIGVGAVTFLSWTLAAASLVGWWLHTAPSRPGSALGGGNVQEVSVDAAAVARFLGQPEAAAAVSQVVAGPAARMSLHGVVAASSHAGVALISVDGKPVRSYRVGSKVDEGWYVVGVERRRALLGTRPVAHPRCRWTWLTKPLAVDLTRVAARGCIGMRPQSRRNSR